MATEKWFKEAFAYSILKDGVAQTTSVVMREVLAGNGKHFDADCSMLTGRFDKMKILLNALKADKHALLMEFVTEFMVMRGIKGVKEYMSGPFMVKDFPSVVKIKVRKYDSSSLHVYIYLNNVQSNFVRFVYENKKFNWLLNVDWFREWCDVESNKIEQKTVVSKPVTEIIKQVLKEEQVETIQIIEKPMPVENVISQVPTREDVKALVQSLKDAGKKVWYWVGVNPLKYADPNYILGWERKAGGPTCDEQTAIDWAEEHQGSVFVSLKKSDLWGNVVHRGEYYSYIPF